MKDKLSALLDGDLDEHSARPVFQGLKNDRDLRDVWASYCLIGDALRGDGDVSDSKFLSKVMAEIDAAPTVLSPSSVPRVGQSAWQSLMPIAASVMGVAAVGWVASALYSDQQVPTQQLTVAQRVAPGPIGIAPVSLAVPRISRPASANDLHREYLFAHQGVGAGPMSGAVQYVRAVSEPRQDIEQ
ncbi:anti-sigma 24 factor [Azoarcus indigens]|uniref:sigma-E factor negative regulatory protein n=1 Tax=Azoarcus indigens TaxID=29545 RepID=UPI00105F2E1E|nr:sigma-E factor negative regulatory protein [Azoarcus indigens]NMG64192.1 anti-sigma 24 factor [Azoarcus indigens]